MQEEEEEDSTGKYDIDQAAADLQTQLAKLFVERPRLSLYYNEAHRSEIRKYLFYYLIECHKHGVKVDFEEDALSYFQFLTPTTFGKSIFKSFQIEAFKQQKSSTSSGVLNAILSVTLESPEPYKLTFVERHRIVNKEDYDAVLLNNERFYLCSLRDKSDGTLLGSFVQAEEDSNEEVHSTIVDYEESIKQLDKQIRKFVLASEIVIYHGAEEIERKKRDIFAWLEKKFTDAGQFIVFEKQKTPYTLRQLFLTPSYDTPSVMLEYAFSRIPRRANSARGKQRLTLVCQERRATDRDLADQCRSKSRLVVNWAEYDEFIRKSPSPENDTIEVAVIKEGMTRIVSLCILDGCAYSKVLSQIARLKRLDEKCKEFSAGDRIRALSVEKDLNQKTTKIALESLTNMCDRLNYDKSKIDIHADLVTFLGDRMDQLTNRELGLPGCVALFQCFYDHTLGKANSKLAEIKEKCVAQGIPLTERLTLEKGVIPLNVFHTVTPDKRLAQVVEMMKDDGNVTQMEYYLERKIKTINTLDVMLVGEIVTSTIIPCVLKNAYNKSIDFVMPPKTGNSNSSSSNDKIITSSSEPKVLQENDLALIQPFLGVDNHDERTAIIEEIPNVSKTTTTTAQILGKRKQTEELETTEKEFITESEAEGNKKEKKKQRIETDNEEKKLSDVIVKRHRIETLDFNQRIQCENCQVIQSFSSFYKHIDKTKYGGGDYHYLSNVCHSCESRKNRCGTNGTKSL